MPVVLLQFMHCRLPLPDSPYVFGPEVALTAAASRAFFAAAPEPGGLLIAHHWTVNMERTSVHDDTERLQRVEVH